MKHLIQNNQIIKSGLPEIFTRVNDELILGGYSTRTDLHYEDGWRDEIIPEYNTETQKLGDRYYDPILEVVTYSIVNKTQEEINSEKINRIEVNAEIMDGRIDHDILKKFIKSQIKSLPDDDLLEFKSMFKAYRIGVIYDKDSTNIDETRFVYNDKLYKVIGTRHTSQLDWLPDTAVSLYVEIAPPGVIAAWKQPLGAHDAYQIGDKVTHNGSTWKCTVANNTWEPGVYGWVVKT